MFALFCLGKSHAQCDPGEKMVQIQIVPDNYPDEISWELKADGILVYSGNFNGGQICLPSSACLEFTMYDSFGDGICCNYGNGSYALIIDGVTVASGGSYGGSETVINGCAPGMYCSDAIVINEGSYIAPQQNYWYSFTPAQNGMYDISTCGLTSCDTKIWVYENCNGNINETNAGTLFFDDNDGGCGQQAVVHGFFEGGVNYKIRIGLATGTSCANDSIPFNLTYIGPIVGCMDPTACNYNPLASVSDNSCIYFPSPDCPNGPDLLLVESEVVNSLNIRQQVATNCMVEEGCMNGYGERTILAFDTHIKNIGDMDYFIGDPSSNPDQFTFNNCHGHAHYEGYADYILYTQNGESIPIGHKNGFCVLDLECNDGGTAQYSCGYMGISKQCGDIYNNALDCQWIDITDVDTGEYILAVKVNWDQSPDALGHYELDYSNNWGQACIRITMDQFGNKGYVLIPNCQPYMDCNGVQYGNTQMDCNGVCGGSAVRGDLNSDALVQATDANSYTTGVLTNSLSLTNCNDISGDGMLSVWDAGLDVKCATGVGATICSFPKSTQNLTQQVSIGYISVNTVDHYVDVEILNPTNKVLGYELNFSGIQIADVENLIDNAMYPITPQFSTANSKVIGISYVDSMIPKNNVPTPMIRIHYTSLTADEVCLESVVHVLNNLAQPVTVNLVDACINLAGIDVTGIPDFEVKPNPANQSLSVNLKSKVNETMLVQLKDQLGRVLIEKSLKDLQYELSLDVSGFSNGVYYLCLKTESAQLSKKVIVKH